MTTLRRLPTLSSYSAGAPTLLVQLLLVASCLIFVAVGAGGGSAIAALAGEAPVSSFSCDFSSFHPQRYAVYHLQSQIKDAEPAITIDGVLNESAWEKTRWTDEFVDIRGLRHWSQPWFATKVKMRYDDNFLYVGAYLEEAEIWANVTHRNDVVFHDNDFEVFVDADGSTHNYKEFEVNAINTTWNLWLNRPYRDGGHENSTRVDLLHGFDMFRHGMKSAVYMKGNPNDAGERLHFWTVEIALPLRELALHSQAVLPPRPYTFWRINFSRVEWTVATTSSGGYVKVRGEVEENWVWSPQYAVNMHMPENWGYIQFRPHFEDEGFDSDVPMDPEWKVRYLSFQLYYAQHAFKVVNGYFARDVTALEPFFQAENAFKCMNVQQLNVTNDGSSFEALLTDAKRPGIPLYAAIIRDDSFIHVHKVDGDIMSVE
uniref:Carbohydrate-binding domain-containing protein n=1 Tax=Globisporangium ultimum (strain ATCC 200006 / CBS 805.95 / DAOM BR144) TaxID=431595 RepID=K3WU16_GLOUD